MNVSTGFDPLSLADTSANQEQLERVIPRSDAVSWLYLRMEPGDPWHPINRLLLWQIWPLKDTPEPILDALKGPSPRSTGHYCGGPGWCPSVDGQVICTKRKMRWVDGPKMGWQVSRQQWEIFREIGRFADPWWVIQGPTGGHRKMLADDEKTMLWHTSGERYRDVPKMGELPYAPFDNRVLRWIREYDVLQRWEESYAKSFTSRSYVEVEQGEEERKQELGKKWAQWLVDQVDEMFEAGASGFRGLANEYRAGGSSLKDERKRSDESMDARWHALLQGTE